MRFLNLPLSQYFGRTSYSLYLWNVPIFELLFLFISPDFSRAHIIEVGLLVGVVTVLVTAPIASFSERWLEQPCIRLGRVVTRLRAPPPLAVSFH